MSDTIIVVRKSILTQKEHSLEVPGTRIGLQRWMNNELPIEQALPDTTHDQRIFIETGITQDEWAELYNSA